MSHHLQAFSNDLKCLGVVELLYVLCVQILADTSNEENIHSWLYKVIEIKTKYARDMLSYTEIGGSIVV